MAQYGRNDKITDKHTVLLTFYGTNAAAKPVKTFTCIFMHCNTGYTNYKFYNFH